jgi:serine/threonine protein kinase/beta-lactam-binding protein with PASTA domain
MINTVIESRFKVKERLVRQGVIEVFEGTDQDEGLPVWIKFLGMPVAQDVEFVNNWRGQLLGVQSIHDRHLPRIISFGDTSDGTLYQIEEPPRGITLGRLRNQRTPMGVPESIKLVAAAARAVSVAHREGVAHGALSPESIYIELEANDAAATRAEGLEDSQLLEAFITHWELGELMIALHHAKLPLHGRLKPYLAPEQLSQALPPPTPAGDVYALGAILYELLTGSLPSLTQTTLPAPPSRFNPAVPLAVEQILLRALSREPSARQPNGQALASALMQALQAPPVAPPNQFDAEPPPRLTQSIDGEPPQRRFSPLWAIVGTIVGLVMLCACILFMVAVTVFPWQQSREAAIPTLTGPQVTATALINTVPNLKGPPYISYNRAVQEAWNRGFRVRIVAFRNDESEHAPPPGVIVEQCPDPGARRGEETSACGADGRFGIISDDMILVEVSSLPDPVVMRVIPDLYGQAEEQARGLLEAGGLRVGTRLPAYDLLIPPGHIIEQNPRRGIAVLPGTPIDIVVSAGLPPTEQDLPLPLPGTSNNESIENQPVENQPVGDSATDNPSGEPASRTATPSSTSPTPPLVGSKATASGANPAYPEPNSTATQPQQQPTAIPSPSASSTPPPTQRVTGSPTTIIDPSSQIVLLKDDFQQGNRLRWIMDEEKSSIKDGVFAIELQEPKEFWQSQPYDSGLFDDYSYRASVTFVDESSASQQEASAGLLFRTQGEEDFYFFEVNGLGEFRLRVRHGKEWIEQLNWTSDPAILPSGATNKLEVRVDSERIVLSINGENVVGGYDMPPEFNFQFGGIGLAVQAGEEPLAVEFDNIVVSR